MALGPPEARLDQIEFALRRRNPAGRLLLKDVQHIDRVYLRCVNRAIGAARMVRDDFDEAMQCTFQALGRRVLLLLPFLRQEERISDRILDLVGARTKILQTRPHPVDRLERRAGHDGICQLWHRTSMLFEMERRTMPGQSPGTYAGPASFLRAARGKKLAYQLTARLRFNAALHVHAMI